MPKTVTCKHCDNTLTLSIDFEVDWDLPFCPDGQAIIRKHSSGNGWKAARLQSHRDEDWIYTCPAHVPPSSSL